MADTASITRRSALASASAVALTPFTPSPFTAAPSERGRQLLRIIRILWRAWRSAPAEGTPAAAAFDAYTGVLHRAASQLAHEIADAPLRTLDDVIDRAIVLAWGRADVPQDAILEPVLALAGIAFADCEHAECREVA